MMRPVIVMMASGVSLLATSQVHAAGSLSDTRLDLPDWSQLVRVLTLQDYNTRVVVIGTMLLGMASGIVGTFMLLRKRALISDAISHATLPGIAVAFIIMANLGGDGKFLPVLLLAAVVTAVAGIGCVLAIRNLTRLKEDAALGIVLSVFFGIGIALLGVIQKMPRGNAAGLESFIYGKTASMLLMDVVLIGVIGLAAVVVCLLLLKEFSLICFDQSFAGAQGWPVLVLDVLMMALVVAVTVVGLQAVGLILVVALLIIPSAAARFWTDRLGWLLAASAVFGGVSGLVGAACSALVAKLPAGAIIVVVASVLFMFSMLFGMRRGVVRRAAERYLLRQRVARQHLLRAVYEWIDQHRNDGELDHQLAVPRSFLLERRSWTAAQLQRALRRAVKDDLVSPADTDQWRLTAAGFDQAARLTRNHRLWEMYLITHADIAPSHVDRDADMVEHVLGLNMVRKLEQLLEGRSPTPPVPPSPHLMKGAT